MTAAELCHGKTGERPGAREPFRHEPQLIQRDLPFQVDRQQIKNSLETAGFGVVAVSSPKYKPIRKTIMNSSCHCTEDLAPGAAEYSIRRSGISRNLANYRYYSSVRVYKIMVNEIHFKEELVTGCQSTALGKTKIS
jgi:hypothetical protein